MNKALILGVVCLPTLTNQAQDNHYEALQLGAKNSILSGASISRWQDNTAVFQNPATLIQSKTNNISFNTAAFNLNNIKLINDQGTKYVLKSSNTSFLPSLVGGDWRPKSRPTDWVLGYAVYHRAKDNLRFTNRIDNSQNILNDVESPGNENYIGQTSLETSFDETAGVFGIGKKLNEKWSIGASFNGIFRNQSYHQSFSGDAIPDPANNPTVDLVSSRSDIDVVYSKALAQLKLGLAFQDKGWSLGLTVMSPSIGIYGSGEIDANLSLTNILLPQNSARKNYLANTRLTKMKATYKYPLNIGAGVSKQFNKIQLSAAATWYAPITKYAVLDPGNTVFIRPSNSQNILATQNFLQVWSVNRSVVNLSFSADIQLKSNLHALLGYALDQNYSESLPEAQGFQLSTKLWNLNHINGGIQFIRPKANWIVGFQTTTGSNNNFRIGRSLENPTEANYLQGDVISAKIKASTVGLIISYSLNIGK